MSSPDEPPTIPIPVYAICAPRSPRAPANDVGAAIAHIDMLARQHGIEHPLRRFATEPDRPPPAS